MKKIITDTLIVGAGPAGLATAMELSKAGKKFIVIERQDAPGGLSKTYEFKEGDLIFRTDNGPHRFFSKNQYLYDFIEDLLHEQWIKVHRQTRQFIDGKFYDYPINAPQALKNLGFIKALRILWDYVIAKIRYGLFRKPVKNFADYVYANFGKTLGEFGMINYTEKIWGIPANEIHIDWAGQRIKGLSLTSVAKDALARLFGGKSKNKPKTLVDTFYYPEYGTGLIYDAIVKRLQDKGYEVLLNTEPQVFKFKGKKFTSVIAKSDGEDIEIEFKTLVESVPLTSFIKMLEPKTPRDILEAGKKLRHRNQVYLFITLDKESITKDQWIYFPSKDVPIGRVSEMKNFSNKMSPEGKTSLFVEFFCFEGDAMWNMTKEELFAFALPHFENNGFFSRSEVRNYYVIKQRDVYPIYDIDYKQFLDKIKKYLDNFTNLYYIGRPGRFRYNNQDHSLEMGMLAARSIIEGKRYNIEKVGDEKEYYESGSLYSKKSD
ncbi:MAG: adrenodoxin reductase [Candidatus Paceibacter sp.]|jgi:protoporphyrinogen oxidase|nr:adrenodoxin reductase [Candidatus Paceibacter sp.]